MKKFFLWAIIAIIVAIIISFSFGFESIGWKLGFVLVAVIGILGVTYNPTTTDYFFYGKRK